MVHRNLLGPIPRPVTPEVGELGEVIAPVPLTKVHVPTAGATAVFPAKIAVLVGRQNC